MQLPSMYGFAAGGYVLKPPEMRGVWAKAAEEGGDASDDNVDSSDTYWPPAREQLHRTTVQILSLHNLPKVSSLH